MTTKNALIVLLFSFLSTMGNAEPKRPDSTKVVGEKPMEQVWAFESNPFWFDEFDYEGVPDSTKWGYDQGGSGWGNNELQYYTNRIENASVNEGLLSIHALKENFHEKSYTSARLVTKNKGDLLYGRVEVRAQLPTGVGTWPAIWMLPTDWEYGGWPASGEIDIMEHVGYDLNNIHISTHCEAYYWRLNNHKTNTKIIPTATTAFHVYRIDWTPDWIKGYIDDELIFTNHNEGNDYKSWPFDKRFHLILNLAIGGDWGGKQGVDNKIFPSTFQIDYVRFFKMIP